MKKYLIWIFLAGVLVGLCLFELRHCAAQTLQAGWQIGWL